MSLEIRNMPRIFGVLPFVASIILLFSCADLPHVPVVSDGFRVPSDFKIVGYFPSWSGDPETIQYHALTHICYAFASPTKDGSSNPIEHEEKLYRVMALAHAAGTKVLLSFGGGGEGDADALACVSADPRLTDAFAGRLLDLISRYNLDGIDVDWEFPTGETAVDFASFIHTIAGKLHAEGKSLSVAVSADAVHGRYYLDGIIEDADFLNIMAYDDGFGEPPGKNHSSYSLAKSSLDYWIGARSTPRSKAILGVPFYGRSLVDRHSISYYRIRKRYPLSPSADKAGDFGYNGFDTIRAKAVNLARYRGGGIMVWQLNQDANGADSLLNAIFDAVKEPRE
jgi:chitinase